MSSGDEWRTPDALFATLHKEFKFTVDLCTDVSNSKCPIAVTDIESFVSKGSDKVGDVYWMNPPYSRGNINICMEQAVNLLRRNHTVVCLVRFDPSTQWFQQYVDDVATEVRMLDKRIKFIGAPGAYNFPCCVVVYDPTCNPDKFAALNTEYSIWGEDE